MKGIIGMVGNLVAGDLGRMSQRLTHRGNAALTSADTFGFGQLSTSENPVPFSLNGITIISDARIDNQPEMLDKIAAQRHLEISTNEFIHMAYSKLGISFVEHLSGDFTIAIADENCRKLFLIRDHMGVRPLYYCFKQSTCLAFASEPKALLSLDFVSSELNDAKLREYLQWPVDHRPYGKATFYKDIFSVMPASVLTAGMDLNTIQETFYWKIDPERFRILTTESLLIAEYRKRFETAVCRRLQPMTGAHVSGGLDSSSIYKVAEKYLRKDQLHSVHFYPGTPDTDERSYANEVVRNNLENHFQIEPAADPLAGIRHSHVYTDRPDLSTIPTGTKILRELALLKNKNVTVILTGHEGDTVVDSGRHYLSGLLLNSKFGEFGKYVEGDDKSSRFKRLYFVKRALSARYSADGSVSAMKFAAALLRHKQISLLELARIIYSVALGLLSRRSRRSANLSADVRYTPSTLTGVRSEHFNRIFSAGIIDMNEILNLAGAAYGIEYAHPFLDRDFIELSLFIPEKLRIGSNGLTRNHFREAMTGILPEYVRLRRSKVQFDKAIWHNLVDAVNSFLRENDLNNEKRKELIRIKRKLQAIDADHPAFSKTKRIQRQLLLTIWKSQLERSDT
ncbi:Asparagine synthetase [glutamine-hydrolyzing] 3 [Dyadobacter sp. CECT 9275]|uniref:asparagine synthase (glutamine-hydrolyzing) n=1 Tax=Dyadobacter helix TaxID=2822344 RepID=A0A916JFR9_9BACT|nr:asparagine synthase-related protein [Dyadobacter sp. CECT 9275]CAG5006883.1 Asparagine synthetase [glutamine-hydrolyzing] 3 [Dyadobacter sp. CECT 9275]